MDNHNDPRFLSIKLYHYLSDVVVGSDKVVKYRRYFYKCCDDTLKLEDCRVISSGSRAEGLDIPGSDLDVMCLIGTYVVDEKQGNTQDKRLILDTDNALPGFALIRITDDSVPVGNINNATQTVDGLLLNNNYLKQTFLEKLNEDSECCITTQTLNIDFKTLCKIQVQQCLLHSKELWTWILSIAFLS
ncbi:unnamed protein product [Mytilus edulis]|uniref:Uncharacterized protein n=1 Tax=Mytilus edulis TaxID=6550 RepID=A0A8S3VA32_MYTED|nr:unnamed protein product [Mytilus edulis]